MIFSTLQKRFWGLALLLLCIMAPEFAFAQSKTEGELVQKIVYCLRLNDSFLYAKVFPATDTLCAITLRKAPPTSDAYQRAKYLSASEDLMVNQDSANLKQSIVWFKNVLKKGKKLGIHWEAITMSRYELEALAKTRDEALEAIAPERFVGYVFIEDQLTRKIFAFTVSDIMKMDGTFYGGELNYIFEANNKDVFNAKLKAEKIRIKKGLSDSTEQNTDSTQSREDLEENNKRKQIADRKYFAGYLDEETPVSLYIRYIEGGCPEGICSWEAIFKFGDNEYSRQEVSKTKEGKWVFLEEETSGVLELELKGSVFKGIFTASLDKVEYDAVLKEKTITKKKLEILDALMDDDMDH